VGRRYRRFKGVPAWSSRVKAGLAMMLVLLFALTLYSWTYAAYELPYASAGFDGFSHLGMVRTLHGEIDPGGHPLVDGFYPALYEGDTHLGPYLTVAAVMSLGRGMTPKSALLLLALFNLALVAFGLYFFFRRYTGDRVVALAGAALVFASTSLEALVKPQSCALADLLVTAHYPATFALGIMFILLGLNLIFLDRPTTWLWLAQALLCFLLITSHPLTGVMYGLALVLLAASHPGKTGASWKLRLVLIGILPAAAAATLLWPFYNWWASLFGALPDGAGGYSPVAHDWAEILRIVGLAFLGLPFLVRWRRLFPLLWCLASLLIALSYLTPLQAPLYWRFAYMARIPLLLGLAWGLIRDVPTLIRRERVRRAVVVLSLAALVAISLYYSVLKVADIALGEKAPDRIAFVEEFQGPGTVLLGTPANIYMAQGLYLFDVPTVTEGHAPQKIIAPRLEEIRIAFASLDPSLLERLIDKYRPRYILAEWEAARDAFLSACGGELVAQQDYFYLIECAATESSWGQPPILHAGFHP
jgi:hypothetical protein